MPHTSVQVMEKKKLLGQVRGKARENPAELQERVLSEARILKCADILCSIVRPLCPLRPARVLAALTPTTHLSETCVPAIHQVPLPRLGALLVHRFFYFPHPRTVSHPHITKFHAIFEDEKELYLLMELVEVGSALALALVFGSVFGSSVLEPGGQVAMCA